MPLAPSKLPRLAHRRARIRRQARTAALRLASTRSTPHPVDECIAVVRRNDHASLLQAPFYPAHARNAFVAIRALNVELATVNESVSSGKPLIGQMRFQFWRDAINGCYEGRPPPNPIVYALAAAIQRHKLSKYHFTRLIDTREQYFLDPSFPSVDSLAAYAQGTSFPLLSLSMQSLLSATRSPSLDLGSLDHSLSHLAHTLTFSTLLHSVPFHARQRVNPLPRDLCGQAGLAEEDLFRHGGDAQGVREAVAEVARLAWGELGAARRTILGTHEHGRSGEEELGRGKPVKVGSDVMPVFLAATQAKAFLRELEKTSYDAMRPSLQKRPWKLPFQTWSDSFFRRF